MSRLKRAEMAPLKPPRDSRLVALAEQAQRAGWETEWVPDHAAGTPWLRLDHQSATVSVCVFPRDGRLSCLALVSAPHAGSPPEALRSAYAALGVALDQAEDAFGGTS